MLWTTHILTGAAMGGLCRSPGSATLNGFCAHLILDLFPHYDQETSTGYVIDSLTGLAVLYLISPIGPISKSEDSRLIFWGAVGAALPYVELLIGKIFHLEQGQLLFPTHNGVLPQPQIDMITSFIIQGILVLSSFALLHKRKNSLS